jgi:GNAT superfamily N-acetyltransferase
VLVEKMNPNGSTPAACAATFERMDLVDLREPDPTWLARTVAVHRQLRPQLPEDYVGKMTRVFAGGGKMVVATEGDAVLGLAVWRATENTSAGQYMYIDDLVTDEAHRSKGVGRALLARCEELAVAMGCVKLVLDSGVQRIDAHRFYFRERFAIHAFNFSKRL